MAPCSCSRRYQGLTISFVLLPIHICQDIFICRYITNISLYQQVQCYPIVFLYIYYQFLMLSFSQLLSYAFFSINIFVEYKCPACLFFYLVQPSLTCSVCRSISSCSRECMHRIVATVGWHVCGAWPCNISRRMRHYICVHLHNLYTFIASHIILTYIHSQMFIVLSIFIVHAA